LEDESSFTLSITVSFFAGLAVTLGNAFLLLADKGMHQTLKEALTSLVFVILLVAGLLVGGLGMKDKTLNFVDMTWGARYGENNINSINSNWDPG